ncbi:YybS family protein [Halobacillus litoralis]|uniref:YybS family protein n=1 Tax=Halobacillus litoralis TaxID=45668 RepID=UPI001CD808E5|nr:YybS family protein [Halobacillus litoralis]MCA0972300.1 YybS family protein [Halobacillus litoralis]
MNDTKRITEGALMTGVYLLLLLVIIFTPSIIGSILILALPVPFIFYSYRYSWKSGALMLVAALIFTLIFATVFSLPATLFAGLGGIFLGGALYQKRTAYETWAVGTVGFSIGFLSIYLSTQLFFGINWSDEIRNSLNSALNVTESMFGGLLTSENQEQLDAFRESLSMLPDLIPSALVLVGIMTAFVAQWLSYKVINRIERNGLRFPPFRELKWPTSILWYYFIALILSYVVTDENGVLYLAVVNIFVLTGFLLVLQGFSFIFYYAEQKKWSKAIPAVIVVVSLLLPQLLLYLVRILGIIDLGFSLRERIERKK